MASESIGLWGIIVIISRQDDANPVCWLATRAGTMNSSRTNAGFPALVSFWPPNKSRYWPSFFGQDGCILASFFVSVHKNAKIVLGQYPVILTSRLVNNKYILIIFYTYKRKMYFPLRVGIFVIIVLTLQVKGLTCWVNCLSKDE